MTLIVGCKKTEQQQSQQQQAQQSATLPSSQKQETTQQQVSAEIKANISVEAQAIQDSQVVISRLYLDKNGFVVIHKETDEKPGVVIGYSGLISGEVSNLKVKMDTTQAGTRVFAMLHYDNGDGIYTSLDEDKPVVLESGAVVKPITITEITAQASASTTSQTTIQTSSQTSQNATISSTTNSTVSASASTTKEFTVTAKQFEFIPGTIEVNEGDYVVLKVTSIDVQHGFAIADFDVNELLPLNQEVVVKFTASKKGTFTFYCTNYCGGGHPDMHGKLIVK